jgi:aspartate aminotransferase-like enzyme
MGVYQPLIYKIATQSWEFELIHRLNYRTFVEEIPQHQHNSSGKLVDKFHEQNTYIICLSGEELIGMVALRAERPFSLDQKLANLDSFLPAGRKLCEVRLLSVEAKLRKTSVFLGLILRLVEVAKSRGYDMALISGTTRQLKLYQHVGFAPFGPVVGSGEARYQPMYLSLEGFEEQVKALLERAQREAREAVFLPGPVAAHEDVARAFAAAPVSHRSAAFRAKLAATKDKLRELTGAHQVALALGSGTLANDMVGAHLSQIDEPGLVLANGEFGERLSDHARRWGLRFTEHRQNWGEPFDFDSIAAHLQTSPAPRWLWAAHSETSTGMLNDIGALRALARGHRLRLCLDAISAVGTVAFSMQDVYLATAVSGKGLAAFPGVGIVLAGTAVQTRHEAKLPRYLDLHSYLSGDSVPFTHSSNLLFALHAALEQQSAERYARIARAGGMLRSALAHEGFCIVTDEAHCHPAVTTIALPSHISSSLALGTALQEQGMHIAYASDYLVARNWIQVCLFGEFSEQSLYDLVSALAQVAPQRRHSKAALG